MEQASTNDVAPSMNKLDFNQMKMDLQQMFSQDSEEEDSSY